MKITMRLEVPADYRAVEELTREAFWGCMDHPTCDGEHLLVHKLRSSPAFVPELDFVAEIEGNLVGHVIYSRSKIVTDSGREIEVLTFGPLSVLPAYQKNGVGSALLRHSVSRAKELGYRAILIYGHPDYYPRFGFRRAKRYGITNPKGSSFDALMALELYDGALDGVSGKFYEDKVFEVEPKEMEEFDKTFPPKAPVQPLPLEALSNKLPSSVFRALADHKIKYTASLQRYSGAELLSWEGIGGKGLEALNGCLRELGFAEKLFPSSYILQLAEMGIRIPVCSHLRTKDGISLYQVESEGRRLILKVFSKREHMREISNYKMLSLIGVQTLPLLGCTENAILMPDVNADSKYRLGEEPDLKDTAVAKAIAGWYRELHDKGSKFLAENNPTLYDETDAVTEANVKMAAEGTGTGENPLWKAISDNFPLIQRKIDALPRTLTYNDFYWTNLVVAKDKSSAFMLDYNLLGKGPAYGDIQNVCSSMSGDAAEAFKKTYGAERIQGQSAAEQFLSPVIALIFACKQDEFPSWAEPSLAALKNGAILRSLLAWLGDDAV